MISAIDVGYLEGVTFMQCTPSKIVLKINVDSACKIRPVLDMIEANVYTKESLTRVGYTVNRLGNNIHVIPYNKESEDVAYDIKVVSKEVSQKHGQYVRSCQFV